MGQVKSSVLGFGFLLLTLLGVVPSSVSEPAVVAAAEVVDEPEGTDSSAKAGQTEASEPSAEANQAERSNSPNPSAGESAASPPVNYLRDIRPILSDHCYACHGPDAENREADLRLDDRDSAFGEADSGAHAIVPGDPANSELIGRISSHDPDLQMPPADTNKPLDAEQIERLRQWIDQGAPWQTHWAFTAPVQPKIPTVSDPTWPTNPIDSFILARLDQESFKPSVDADKETLLRRVTFDLTGLPPTLAEMDAFLADHRPDAYPRVVNRLLQSPHYGEHMARFWLDAARYGDTHGLHLDNYREIWPYRDWVVRAFNQNMPYDQFTIKQLAGDLIPDATLDDKIATGMNRCNVSTNEGGSIEEEVYVRNVVDRVVTTGTVFLGLTMECTRCHDHKYDPLTMRDFYSMFAFFNSIDGPAMDGNVKDTKPTVLAPSKQQAETLARLQKEIKQLATRKERLRSEQEAEFQQWCSQQRQPDGIAEGILPEAPSAGLLGHYPGEVTKEKTTANQVSSEKPGHLHGKVKAVPGRYGNGLQLTGDAYVDLGERYDLKQDQPFSLAAWLQIPNSLTGTILAKAQGDRKGYTLKVDRGRVALDLINRADGYGIQVASETRPLALAGWHHLLVAYDGSGKAAGVVLYVDGHRQQLQVKLDSLTAKGKILSIGSGDAHLLIGRFGKGRQDQGENLAGGQIDELRIYNRRLSSPEVIDVMLADGIGKLLALAADARTEEQVDELRTYYFNRYNPEYLAIENQEDQCHLREVELKSTFPTTLVFREREKPRQAYVLKRGEYDQRGETVDRNTPAFLPAMANCLPRNRLGLAQWLVSPRNPLTARVAVNRFWAQCFGTGLVKTTENFGSQGEVPSHPKLLDWLALQLIESGWDIQEMMKSIVLSHTYRQSSRISSELLEHDPANRLLARGPRFRLDAEMLRDQALAVSGLLIPKLGGPSVKPPQPAGLWHSVGYSGSNTVRFVADQEPEKIHRRTLYTFIKRTSPPPQMSTFDGPSRESCSVRRERTNTPLQALLLLNDPQYVEAAAALAERVMLQAGGNPTARARTMLRLCTGQRANQEATDELLVLYRDIRARFREHEQEADALVQASTTATVNSTVDSSAGHSPEGHPLDRREWAAWTLVANLVLNLDEVVTKN